MAQKPLSRCKSLPSKESPHLDRHGLVLPAPPVNPAEGAAPHQRAQLQALEGQRVRLQHARRRMQPRLRTDMNLSDVDEQSEIM